MSSMRCAVPSNGAAQRLTPKPANIERAQLPAEHCRRAAGGVAGATVIRRAAKVDSRRGFMYPAFWRPSCTSSQSCNTAWQVADGAVPIIWGISLLGREVRPAPHHVCRGVAAADDDDDGSVAGG